ncbi:MAG TPA: RNA polymerase sigma factor [Saprospiraceae bacterium]|nr:RNA polymerase sigma factor [Saprospiraceae bacterium]
MDKRNRFIKLIQQNEGLIFKVATLYTKSLQDKEDLYQEIVFQLWKALDTFNEESKLSTWMYRVAMNTAIYNLKSAKKQINAISIENYTECIDEESNVEEEESLMILYQSIQTLSLLEKGIILLYLEGKSHQEIAEIIGISLSNVGTKIARIKEKLRNKIKKTQ